MASRWGRLLGLAGRGLNGAGYRAAMGAAAVTGLALSGRNEQYGVPLRMESIEERLRKLEARVKILDIKDAEEIRAVEIIKMDAKQHGLKLEGGTIRRTSSRFCLGVEHGDYNGTELFGVGTDRFIWMAYKPNNSGKIRIYSHNFPGEGVVEFTPGKIPPPQSSEIADVWARFVYGVDHVMRKHGYSTSQGFDATIVGNIPGGGMSRSASLILNVLLTMMELNGCSLPHGDFKVVTMACEVENEYVGTPCGNLDQIMIYYAKQGMGTRFNPKTKEVTYIPLGLDAEMFRIAALDTGTVRHGLEKSTYAVRVKECQELVQLLKKNGYKVACLGDVKDRATYDKIMSQFGESHPHLLRRLEYIYFAQERFEAMVKAWADGRIEEVGAIFRRDGIGLRDEYQISGPELEAMVDVARTVPGVIGERMLGGGDKGASGAILHPEAESGLRTAVDTGFKRSYPNLAEKCAVHVVRVCKGIEVMEGLL